MLRSSLRLIGVALALGVATSACAGRAFTPAVPARTPALFAAEPLHAAPQLPQPANESLRQFPGSADAGQSQPGFTEQKPEPAAVDELLATAIEAPIATPQTTATVSQDLRLTVYDIDIPLNTKVLSYVQLFTGRLKGYLEDGLSRGARFLPMIQAVFRAEGLPLDLAYVPLIESAFKPTAVSRAKAKGIWQFMYGTALENGLKADWYIDERADPEKATYAAARYLKTLHQMFGDWHLALAAYNSGPGRVQRAMKASGRDDYWKLTATSRYLPRETRDYVPLILAAVIVARNPAQYGLTVTPPPMPAPEDVLITFPVDLRRVAEWAGVPVETIQALNPELRRWTTPVRAEEYWLKVPEGTGDFVRAGLQSVLPEDVSPFNLHTVRKGETLAAVANKLGVTRTDLAEANYLTTRATLRAGQQLIIPKAPSTSRANSSQPPADAQMRQVDIVLASTVGPAAAQDSKQVHRVKRGETLTSIAKLYRITVAALKEWNGLESSAIQIGQRLTIVTPRTVATN